jgi:3-deoxy-D-manno-octulosonate 8-phosphate phosphatase (KDO 8-P phosphatase)
MSKIIISDVDGVLNTGQFLYNECGKQFKIFGPHDGDGVKILKKHGFNVEFVSADHRGFKITKARIDDMKCNVELVSEGDRYDFINKKYGLENVIYIGDGLHDAKILKDAYFGIAPIDARIEAKRAAQYITESKAGNGAFLDAALIILKHFGVKYEQE